MQENPLEAASLRGDNGFMPLPRVTVLMTTYNGAAFIGASIESVLAQSFADFELLIVDDGSTDDTAGVIARYSDPRLRLLQPAANGGIVAARNLGFAAARGAYVAALDHDDLADPGRLAEQVAYLDQHPGVVLVGTEIRIDDNGRIKPPDHPREGDPVAMRWQLLTDNPLTWSSVMFRAEAVHRLGGFMRTDYQLADDFDFYHRMLGVGEIARLDGVLTTYRYHASNTSHAEPAALNRAAAQVLAEAYRPWLGEGAEGAAMLVVRHLSDRQPVRDGVTLRRLGEVLETLLGGFGGADLAGVDRERIAGIAGRAWWRSVRAAVRSGHPWLIWGWGGASRLAGAYRPGWRDVVAS